MPPEQLGSVPSVPVFLPGRCLGVFTDSAAAPLKQLWTAARLQVGQAIGAALQTVPMGASFYVQQVNNMVNAGAADASEAAPALAAATAVGASASTAAPYVVAATPYAITAGGDAVLLNGVVKEVQSGMSGQCTW